MNHNEFFNALKHGSIENVYCFYGPEEFIKRRALDRLRSQLLPAGLETLNDVVLENCSAQDIICACDTLPVMCERRIVTVRDWAPLLPGKSKKGSKEDQRKSEDEAEDSKPTSKKGADNSQHTSKDEAEDSKPVSKKGAGDSQLILNWLQHPSESCVLIFYFSVEPDMRKKLTSELRKRPGWVNFDHLEGEDLQKWCARELKQQGKHITRQAVNLLNEMAGPELTQLSRELDKLAAYAGEDELIDVPAVQAMVTPSPEYNVFRILDNLLAGHLGKATELVNSELSNDNNPVRLIALISNQLRLDTHVKVSLETGKRAEMTSLLGISPNRYSAIMHQIRDIPTEELRARYLYCVEADYSVKSGRLRDRAALDLLMLKLVRNK